MGIFIRYIRYFPRALATSGHGAMHPGLIASIALGISLSLGACSSGNKDKPSCQLEQNTWGVYDCQGRWLRKS